MRHIIRIVSVVLTKQLARTRYANSLGDRPRTILPFKFRVVFTGLNRSKVSIFQSLENRPCAVPTALVLTAGSEHNHVLPNGNHHG
jgi:hypothetical protein